MDDHDSYEIISDFFSRMLRKLVCPQGLCSKSNYISQEVLNSDPFDGFAINNWAAGIVLFIMIV